MAEQRRSREWWDKTVTRWRRSGASAAAFAEREGLKVGTLRWWSSALVRDTRATHGSQAAIVPIEIAIPGDGVAGGPAGVVEIAVAEAIVRCPVGVDVAYVASLIRAIAG